LDPLQEPGGVIGKNHRDRQLPGCFERTQSVHVKDIERCLGQKIAKPKVGQPRVERLLLWNGRPVYPHAMQFTRSLSLVPQRNRNDIDLVSLFDQRFAEFHNVGRNATHIGMKIRGNEADSHTSDPRRG
jgi:hypothetical protein